MDPGGVIFIMFDNIPWTQVVTAIVAIYAAVVSTITLLTNRKDKARLIKVTLSNGFLAYTNNTLSEDAMLFVTVTNKGLRATTLNIPYLLLPKGKKFFFPVPQSSVTYPHKLEDGTNFMMWIGMHKLADTLRKNGFSGKVKIHAEVADAADNKYRSKAHWTFDTNQWRNPQ
jgi:hypothetical protein